MGYSNGLITAPVSVADVAAVLGVSGNDTGTLCMSDAINPVSIICPRYTTRPGLMPANFDSLKDTTVLGAHVTAPAYFSPKWGVHLPYVYGNNIGNVWKYRLAPWVINRPTTDSMKSLHHFAGYKADAKAAAPMRDYTIAAGAKVAVTLYSPGREDVLNNGGSLSVANIFDTGYFGCTVYSQPGNMGSAFVDGVAGQSFINPTKIRTDGQATTARIETDIVAEAGRYYGIVPWVCDRSALSADAMVFPLCIVPGFMSYADRIVQAADTPVNLTRVLYADGYNPWGSEQDSFALYVGFRIQSSVAATVTGFGINVEYKTTSGTVETKTLTAGTHVAGGAYSGGAAYVSAGGDQEVVFKFALPAGYVSETAISGFCTYTANGSSDKLAKEAYEWDAYNGSEQI